MSTVSSNKSDIPENVIKILLCPQAQNDQYLCFSRLHLTWVTIVSHSLESTWHNFTATDT